jgi:hypothetical protein
VSEYYLGCDGVDVNIKPTVTSYLNRFIEKGEGKEVVPGPGKRHIIDVYGYYHKRDDQTFSVGTPVATAFVIETKNPGIYILDINFAGDEFRGEVRDLKLVVENEPETAMRCAITKHRKLVCKTKGIHPISQH